MNTGNVYYFIDDLGNICKQEKGTQKEFSEIIELQDLIDDNLVRVKIKDNNIYN